ncbi:MAG: VOC family protein [Gaiellaceae bacterium]
MKALGLVWLGIRTDDLEETLRLFRDVLGLEPVLEEEGTVELELPRGERVQLFGPGHTYHDRFEGAGPVPLFEVDDLEEAGRRLRERGLEIGPRDQDAAWEWFDFRGPDGNVYELARRLG